MKHATITPTDNGPYLVEGSAVLVDAEGGEHERHRRDRSLPLRPLRHEAVLRRDAREVQFSAVNRLDART
jgi:hypothetical protein